MGSAVLPVIAGVTALANLVGGASDQAQGTAAVNEAADIARQNYQQTAGLRAQAIARMMARQPTAPDLTGIVTDTRNPYNTRFASPANLAATTGATPAPDYSAAASQAPAAASNGATVQGLTSYDPSNPNFGQDSQIATGNYAGLQSLDPLAGSPMQAKGPTPVYQNLQSVPPTTKLTSKQIADLTAEAKATGNWMAAANLLKEHGQTFPAGT